MNQARMMRNLRVNQANVDANIDARRQLPLAIGLAMIILTLNANSRCDLSA